MKQLKVLSEDLMPVIKDLLESGQEVLLTVSGTSMRPFYKHHQTIVKLISPPIKLKKYDVILYQDKGKYKLHRIVKIKPDYFIVCGDALIQIETINSHQIFGLVVEHRYRGKIVLSSSKRYLFKVRIWALLKPFRSIMLRLFGG